MASNDEALIRKLVSDKGTSNDRILSDIETHRGRLLLSNSERELSELNQHLAPLIVKHQQLDSQVLKFRLALAPHKDLPVEIISNIFILASDGGAISIPLRITDVPWVFRQVCSRWREVAVNEPRLWSRLMLSSYKPKVLQFASLIVPRTGSLSVALCGPGPSNGARALNLLILPNLSRITDLSLRLPIGAFEALWKMAPAQFSKLESADLEILRPNEKNARSNQLYSKWQEHDTEPFPTSSCLRRIKLKAPMRFTLCLISLNYPWHQLTDVDLTGVESLFVDRPQIDRGFHRILTQCISLTKLSAFVPARGTMDIAHGDLPLPHLQCLTLISISDDWLFRSLVVPALSELHVGGELHRFFGGIHGMITSSGCTLKTFHHTAGKRVKENHSTSLRNFLSVMPAITEFKSAFITLHRDILRSIANGVLLPNLEVLECRPGAPEAFVDVVEARVMKDPKVVRATLYKAVAFFAPFPFQEKNFKLASKRLEAVNRENRTDFRFIWEDRR